ncbi:MAG: hypothetical protein IT572_01790 [Deltaproteobacteria bacterium]|nr:hypothetical protein [Deltaproteobacteria bacterium]
MAYEPINPDNLKFLPSPSDCPAEIYWPDSLKTYQDIVQVNPYLKGQNYLDTLLLSRQGTFPLEVRDTSLDVFLGLKGPADFPKFKLEVPHDAQLCAGPAKPGGTGFEACEGLEIELKDEDIGLTLEGLDLLSSQNLDLGIAGMLGIKIQGASVRDGRLLVTLQLANPLLNASFPLVFTNEDLLGKLNPTLQKLLRSAAPNPYDPDRYDLDLTSLVLEKMPVAYRVATGEAVNFSEYQAATDKLGLKTFPYFFNMAREGKFPDRLSFNQLYEAVTEYRKSVKPTDKKQDEAQQAILQKLFETVSLRARLHPGRLLFKNLYVEFADEPDKNLLETQLSVKNLKDATLALTAPLHISRLYSPGGIDITQLKGDLGLAYRSNGESELRLDNLEIEFGRMEYGGAQEKGTPSLLGLVSKLQRHFRLDPTKPGKFAILGGRITGLPDPFNISYTAKPALHIVGDPGVSLTAEVNLRMEGLRLRLPMLGEVTLHGKIEGGMRLVPKIVVETLADGSNSEKTLWVPEPNSTHLRLSDLEVVTGKGQRWSRAAVEVFDDSLWSLVPAANSSSAFVTKIEVPEMTGGSYSSLRIDGGMMVPKDIDGLYDFSELAKAFVAELTMQAVRVGGNPEAWNLNLSGSHRPDSTQIKVALDSRETDPAGTLKRRPLEGLEIIFDRNLIGDQTSFAVEAKAKSLDFPGIHLSAPKLELSASLKPTNNGGFLYTVPNLKFTANPWKDMPKTGVIRGPVWIEQKNLRKSPLTLEIDGAAPTFEIKNLNLNFGFLGFTHEKMVKATGGRITGVDVDGALRGFWKMDYDAFRGKGLLTLAGDAGGEGDIHLRGADFLRLAKDDPRDAARLVEIPIFSKTTWTLWNILGVDPDKERINGAFKLSTKVDPAFARVFNVIIDNGKVLNWSMTHDHLPYTAKGYEKKMEEYVAAKAAEERKAEEAKKAEEARKAEGGKTP